MWWAWVAGSITVYLLASAALAPFVGSRLRACAGREGEQ